jgi:hypothetical protein
MKIFQSMLVTLCLLLLYSNRINAFYVSDGLEQGFKASKLEIMLNNKQATSQNRRTYFVQTESPVNQPVEFPDEFSVYLDALDSHVTFERIKNDSRYSIGRSDVYTIDPSNKFVKVHIQENHQVSRKRLFAIKFLLQVLLK